MTTLAAVLCLVLAPGGETISLRDYRARLAATAQALDRSEIETVHREAKALLVCRIRHDGTEFASDETLLGPLSKAEPDEARKLKSRLAALLAAIDAIESGPPPAEPDRVLLERLRRDEATGEVRKGGAVPGLPEARVPRSFAERAGDFFEWLGEKIKAFFRWLGRMFIPDQEGGPGGIGMPLFVAILVALLVIAVGAVTIAALRRKRAGGRTAAAASGPAASARDEDPLSRTAGEWERFAQELARAGRFREAIRAWYHALLATLFHAGVLHYRRDRTNWEYAYALAPQHAWRPDFLEATRRFELEWYGRRDSAEETAGEYERQARRILGVVREGAKE